MQDRVRSFEEVRMMKPRYYVHYNENGDISRLAKVDDITAYAWIDGEWVEMPGLIDIEFDATRDYYEISEEKANSLIKGGKV